MLITCRNGSSCSVTFNDSFRTADLEPFGISPARPSDYGWGRIGFKIDPQSSSQAGFLAADAGHSTVKQFINKCNYYEIPLICRFNKAELSQAIGQARTVVAVEQAGFAKRMIELSNDAEETTK